MRNAEIFVNRDNSIRLFICACAGLINAFSISWPLDFVLVSGSPVWSLNLLAMAILYRFTASASSLHVALTRVYAFCIAWLTSTLWWLYVAMHIYGGLPAFAAIFALLALVVALSSYYALTMSLFCRWSRPLGQAKPIVFSALWTVAELARGTWFTGFGWGGTGYAHVEGPFAAFAPWVGVYGVGAVAVLAASAVSLKSTKVTAPLAVALGLIIATNLGLSQFEWTKPVGSINVSLLQGNIAQDEKFEVGAGVPMALEWYATHLKSAAGELVVAPETAIPLLPSQLPHRYLETLREVFQSNSRAALIGIPLGSFTTGYTNSVIALGDRNAQTWQYNKHHLVPFGEFIPPLFKWFTRMMNIPLGDFERGELNQEPFEVLSQRIAVNICYEDLFGEELAARFSSPGKSPTFFANVSNIGWFGDTMAIDQHLSISRMRALEFQRSFVRATNTGTTAFLNHKGQVVAALPRLTQGVLDGQVTGHEGLTPYVWWVSRWGLWPLWCIAGICIVWAMRRKLHI